MNVSAVAESDHEGLATAGNGDLQWYIPGHTHRMPHLLRFTMRTQLPSGP